MFDTNLFWSFWILDTHVLPTPQREAWHGIVVASPRRLRRSPQWLGHDLGSVETCDCQVIVKCFQQIWRNFAVDLIYLTYTWACASFSLCFHCLSRHTIRPSKTWFYPFWTPASQQEQGPELPMSISCWGNLWGQQESDFEADK